MSITAAAVQALRKATGMGMMEAKGALVETAGDIDKAIDLLREKGLIKMGSREDRESAEGRVAAATSDDRTKAAVVLLNTETDFTANNEAFVSMTQQIADQALTQVPGEAQKTADMQSVIDEVRLTTKENVQFGGGRVLGGEGKTVGTYVHFTGKKAAAVEVSGDAPEELLRDICMHITAIEPAPLGVDAGDIPDELVQKEREIAKAQAMEQGKPEQIAEKMVEGKIRKYLDTVALVRQPFIKDDKQSVGDLLPDGVTITHFARYQVS
jgi:elongation factor Ts